jgi:hypothetical protein
MCPARSTARESTRIFCSDNRDQFNRHQPRELLAGVSAALDSNGATAHPVFLQKKRPT